MNYLFLIFIVLHFINFFHATPPHKCGHSHLKNKIPHRVLQLVNQNPNGTIQSEKDRIARGDPPQFSNLRIKFDFQFLNESLFEKNMSKLDFAKNTLLPTLRSLYSSTLKVFPRKTPIYPSNFVCGWPYLKINIDNITNGYPDTDLLIYVIAEYNPKQDYIAWATSCEQDPDNYNRPYIGVINMNLYYLDCDIMGFDSCFKVMAHETFHVFVFNSILYSSYVDDNGQILDQSKVIMNSTTKH